MQSTLLYPQATPEARSSVTLSNAVTHDIRAPLSALRSTLEELSFGLPPSDPRAQTLRRALRKVNGLSRSVQALLDWTVPDEVTPVESTLDEIAHAILDHVPQQQHGDVLLAVENRGETVFVDGLLLARCLAHLVGCGLETGDAPVLVHLRSEADAFAFSVLQPACETSNSVFEQLAPRCSTLGLGLEIARREAVRLGGTIDTRRDAHGFVACEIRVPRNASLPAEGLGA